MGVSGVLENSGESFAVVKKSSNKDIYILLKNR